MGTKIVAACYMLITKKCDNSMMKLSVLVVDDHKLFREGFSNMLQELPYVEKVTQACDGKEFLQLLFNKHSFDIVFMDVSMPVMDGVLATAEALKLDRQLKIIALTMHAQHDTFEEMDKAGCVGYVLKSASFIEIQKAIVTVLDGGCYKHSKLMDNPREKANDGCGDMNLFTDRELEIINLIGKGLTSVKIAKDLRISKKTVDKHRENIFVKSGAGNSIDLVVYAIKNKIIKV